MSKTKSCAIRKDSRFSKTQRKVLDVLVQARAIVRLKKYWTQGVWGELPGGSDVGKATDSKDYKGVCRVCAEGAVYCSSRTRDIAEDAIAALDTVARRTTEHEYIQSVNDDMGQKATVAVFSETIKKLRKELKVAEKAA